MLAEGESGNFASIERAFAITNCGFKGNGHLGESCVWIVKFAVGIEPELRCGVVMSAVTGQWGLFLASLPPFSRCK